MHELGIVENVLALVRESAESHCITKVKKIKLVVGKASMALPESLRFAFDVLSKEEELFKEASLEIEERDTECHCLSCDFRFSPQEEGFACPCCRETRVEIVKGRELFVDFFEGE